MAVGLSDTIIQIPVFPKHIEAALKRRLPTHSRNKERDTFRGPIDGEWVDEGELLLVDHYFWTVSPVAGVLFTHCGRMQGGEAVGLGKYATVIRPFRGQKTVIPWKSCLRCDENVMRLAKLVDDPMVQTFLRLRETSILPRIAATDFIATPYLGGRAHPARAYMENEPVSFPFNREVCLSQSGSW